MTIKVTGKNLDVGESLRAYVQEKIEVVLEKYSGRSLSGQASVEKYNDGFKTHCAIHLASGLDMQSTGEGNSAYASVDSAVDRFEKRLRRYKRRIKNHNTKSDTASTDDMNGVDYILAAEKDDDTAEADAVLEGFAPAVIAEAAVRIRPMSVSDAVMQMDLADRAFLVFRNAAHGGVNVVYKRDDGNIGWIDAGGVALAR